MSKSESSVVAIGNFDGVHLGHQAMLHTAAQLANTHSLPLIALTFDPHPRAFFNPGTAPGRLTSSRLKESLLRQLGAEPVTLPFNAELANMSAERFITDILQDRLQATHVVVGEGFTFGRQRQGNVTTLQQKFELHNVTALPLRMDAAGEPYNSTRIRKLIAAGQMDFASQLLGRPYVLEMGIQKLLWPPEGVYSTYYSENGQDWQNFTLKIDDNGPVSSLSDGYWVAFSSTKPQISLKPSSDPA